MFSNHNAEWGLKLLDGCVGVNKAQQSTERCAIVNKEAGEVQSQLLLKEPS